MKSEQITEQIIGCAFRVYNAMGFGYLESVYEKCLAIELAKAGLQAEFQLPISIHYQGYEVGKFMADVLVEKSVLVELKSIKTLLPTHEAQLVNYLVATKIDVGLLINFAEQKVEVKRKVRVLEE